MFREAYMVAAINLKKQETYNQGKQWKNYMNLKLGFGLTKES